jgi:hypothetical protein
VTLLYFLCSGTFGQTMRGCGTLCIVFVRAIIYVVSIGSHSHFCASPLLYIHHALLFDIETGGMHVLRDQAHVCLCRFAFEVHVYLGPLVEPTLIETRQTFYCMKIVKHDE